MSAAWSCCERQAVVRGPSGTWRNRPGGAVHQQWLHLFPSPWSASSGRLANSVQKQCWDWLAGGDAVEIGSVTSSAMFLTS